MTTLLQDLQTVLAPVTPGGAWYQVNESQPPVTPYVVYSRVISTTNNSLQGPSNLQNTRVQVDVYARTMQLAEAAADAADVAMRAGPWASCVQVSATDMYEAEVRLYRVVRDFSLWATN